MLFKIAGFEIILNKKREGIDALYFNIYIYIYIYTLCVYMYSNNFV